MIRVVLAVALATALVGFSLPVAERAERDRNVALATGELDAVASAMERLVANNDPVLPDRVPASTTLEVRPPAPTLTEGGLLVVDDDRLLWRPATGRNHSVDSGVPFRVDSTLRITRRTRLRLSFVRVDGTAVVHVERARVYDRSRDETSSCSKPSCHRTRPVGASRGSTATASA